MPVRSVRVASRREERSNPCHCGDLQQLETPEISGHCVRVASRETNEAIPVIAGACPMAYACSFLLAADILYLITSTYLCKT
jgi:hypothetical protein